MTEDTATLRQGRKFMVVVDETPECQVALRFAARRAANTNGGIVLLRIIEPEGFGHWMAVEERMREEANEEAETLLRELAAEVHALSGVMPEIVVRHGHPRDEVLQLITDDQAIRVLVLGAGTGAEGPGPLVSALAGQMSGTLPIPVTVVPGNLSLDQIDAIT